MKPTTALINGIESIVAHFASISRGNNIHLWGGLGVNEKIAVPRGSFPVKVGTDPFWQRREYDFPELHEDGTLEVAVYQVASERPALCYDLSELVPYAIIRKLKKKNFAQGIGIIASPEKLESSIINNVGEYRREPILKREDYSQFFDKDKNVYQYIGGMGTNAILPYLLVSPNMKVESVIEEFLRRYQEAFGVKKIDTQY